LGRGLLVQISNGVLFSSLCRMSMVGLLAFFCGWVVTFQFGLPVVNRIRFCFTFYDQIKSKTLQWSNHFSFPFESANKI
jgi:hypothetical protein